MKFDCAIKINGREYKFNYIEDDPLRLVMIVSDSYELIRDINCDIPFEKWILVKKYKSILNGVEKDDVFLDQVYHGRDISDEGFMKQLLKSVLFHIYVDDEQDIRTRE